MNSTTQTKITVERNKLDTKVANIVANHDSVLDTRLIRTSKDDQEYVIYKRVQYNLTAAKVV